MCCYHTPCCSRSSGCSGHSCNPTGTLCFSRSIANHPSHTAAGRSCSTASRCIARPTAAGCFNPIAVVGLDARLRPRLSFVLRSSFTLFRLTFMSIFLRILVLFQSAICGKLHIRLIFLLLNLPKGQEHRKHKAASLDVFSIAICGAKYNLSLVS